MYFWNFPSVYLPDLIKIFLSQNSTQVYHSQPRVACHERWMLTRSYLLLLLGLFDVLMKRNVDRAEKNSHETEHDLRWSGQVRKKGS